MKRPASLPALAAPALLLSLGAVPAFAQDGGADGGAMADGGASEADAGSGPGDAGVDAGSEIDAGLVFDAGPPIDAGPAPFDGGAVIDAGLPGDAGLPPVDGGAPFVDAGAPPVDGGLPPADGGSVDCTLRCEGAVLRFCDAVTGMPLSIDCTELDARCGLLSMSWGPDCLLPEGAECSPGYAEGLSRCDPAGPLYCNDGTCQDEPGDYTPPEIDDDAGGLTTTPDDDEGPLSCIGCDDTSSLPFGLAVLLGLRLRRRRR